MITDMTFCMTESYTKDSSPACAQTHLLVRTVDSATMLTSAAQLVSNISIKASIPISVGKITLLILSFQFLLP